MKFIKILYSLWAVLWFFLIYFALFPFFVLIIQKESWHKYTSLLNKIWTICYYIATGVYMRVKKEQKIDKKGQYIFCSNHTSYLDIPAVIMGIPNYFVFLGKKELSKVPLFGYMFKNLHIEVDRKNKNNVYKTYEDSINALKKGKSLLLFPEGGTTPYAPKMKPFKDGAFKMAIEQGVPIVPITIPYNYLLWDSYKPPILSWHNKSVVIFHKEIPTKGLTKDDVPALKKQVRNIIETELRKYVDYDNVNT